MKTKLQIYRSAEQAAQDSLTQPTKFASDTFAIARFESEGLDPRDYDYWSQVYQNSRQAFAQLAAQKSFSPLAQPTT
jgi:hypothetical protein